MRGCVYNSLKNVITYKVTLSCSELFQIVPSGYKLFRMMIKILGAEELWKC